MNMIPIGHWINLDQKYFSNDIYPKKVFSSYSECYNVASPILKSGTQ